MKQFKTAESVCMGHPDKLCDYIADSILDRCLKLDRNARVACEVMATKGNIIIAGEISLMRIINKNGIILETAKEAVKNVGYNPEDFTFQVLIHGQSEDIAHGVDHSLETRDGDAEMLGAGDQGTVYGYATDETEDFLPLPLVLAHRLCRFTDEARQKNVIPALRPDGKAQVTIEYEKDKPVRVEAIVLSVQHAEDADLTELRELLNTHVIKRAFEIFPLDEQTKVYINPSGRFVEGGPAADTGLTGRKIMVDTYGGLASHGGGAFSGKDPTKVDRSGAYMARYIAKTIVRTGLAKRCEIAISYAIGKANPVAVAVNTFGTSEMSDEALAEIVNRVYNMSPGSIIERVGLFRPIFAATAQYGHFHPDFPWELEDLSAQLFQAVADGSRQKPREFDTSAFFESAMRKK